MHWIWNWIQLFFHILIRYFPTYSMRVIWYPSVCHCWRRYGLIIQIHYSVIVSDTVFVFDELASGIELSLPQPTWQEIFPKTRDGVSKSQEEYFPKMIIQRPCQAQQPNLCQILSICILTQWKATASALNSPLFQPSAQSAPYSPARQSGPPKLIC